MALSTKKRNIILAMWKTGEFKSATAIAKHYKISTKTAQKIIAENSHDNEDIVDLGIQYNMALKSTKNPHEINTIEKVVSERVKASNIIYDLTGDNLDGLSKYIKKGVAHKVITEGMGGGASSGIAIEYPMQSEHFKANQETIHKAGVTWGVVDTKPDVAIQNNNNQQNNTVNEIVGYGVKTIESKG